VISAVPRVWPSAIHHAEISVDPQAMWLGDLLEHLCFLVFVPQAIFSLSDYQVSPYQLE
jgi:hypothetical protein